MALKDVKAETPRFDVFFTAAQTRRDDWQRLHSLGQAWSAATGANRDAGKLVAEAKQVLTALEVLENYYAYPGPTLMQRLRERLDTGDSAGFAESARRVARALLGGTYRRDDSVWELSEEEPSDNRSRAPSYARGTVADRLYFEVLVVGTGSPADAERV